MHWRPKPSWQFLQVSVRQVKRLAMHEFRQTKETTAWLALAKSPTAIKDLKGKQNKQVDWVYPAAENLSRVCFVL